MPYSKTITKVWLACETCREPFLAKRSEADRRATCSDACKAQVRTLRALVEMVCKGCGIAFSVIKSARRSVEHAFCGLSCAATYNRNGPGNAAGWRVGADGYVMRYEGGKKILQHREAMQETLGRKLKPNENVHHINGIKSDNAPENLELWSVHQPKGQRVSDLLLIGKQSAESSWVSGLLYC